MDPTTDWAENWNTSVEEDLRRIPELEVIGSDVVSRRLILMFPMEWGEVLFRFARALTDDYHPGRSPDLRPVFFALEELTEALEDEQEDKELKT